MRNYSEWVGQMAGTIEDGSIIDVFIGDELNGLQRRMLIADMLVPWPNCSSEVQDWMRVFCISLDGEQRGEQKIMSEHPSNVLGSMQYHLYYNLITEDDYREWIRNFRKMIRNKK